MNDAHYILDGDGDPEELIQTLIEIEDDDEFDTIGTQISNISQAWLTAKRFRDGKTQGH